MNVILNPIFLLNCRNEIIFEFFEPSESHPIHNEILIERGEGISDLVFLVDDLEAEKIKLLNLLEDWKTSPSLSLVMMLVAN